VGPWPLVIAMVLPSVITFVYFVLLRERETGWQQLAYLFGKSTQFSLPIVFCLPWSRGASLAPARAGESSNSAGWFGVGWWSGVLFAAVIVGAYFVVLRNSSYLDVLTRQLSLKLGGLGLATPLRYLMLSLFYCVVHSFLEEYYWRWFVFQQLTNHVSVAVALFLSSLAFMAHHVILLGILMGWTSWLTYASSLGVAMGGGFWAWLYWRSGQLAPGWLSHFVVDAAIMAIGYSVAATAWTSSST
jgi:membrane protease YdiL (CAAX protease family)